MDASHRPSGMFGLPLAGTSPSPANCTESRRSIWARHGLHLLAAVMRDGRGVEVEALAVYVRKLLL